MDHGIEFVNLTDLPSNTDLLLTVSDSAGATIGSKAFRSLSDGTYEVNHIGAEEGDCFDGATSPDIRPGDTLSVKDSGGAVLQSYTVADVRYAERFDPAVAATATTPGSPATMVVSGWARSADGTTAIAAPELRLQRGDFDPATAVTGGSLDDNRGNRLLIGPNLDGVGVGTFTTSVSPITEDLIDEAILEVIEGANATSFSGDASFALPGCPDLDTSRGAVATPPLPPPPAPAPGPAPAGGAALPPQVITRTVFQAIPGPGAAAASQGVLGSTAGSALRVSNLSLARRISVTRLRLQGLRASMRLPQGTKAVRMSVFKARNGKKIGRALFTVNRAPRATGLYRLTLRNAALLRKLRAGSYVMEVRAGRNGAELGSVRRIAFTVTR